MEKLQLIFAVFNKESIPKDVSNLIMDEMITLAQAKSHYDPLVYAESMDSPDKKTCHMCEHPVAINHMVVYQMDVCCGIEHVTDCVMHHHCYIDYIHWSASMVVS